MKGLMQCTCGARDLGFRVAGRGDKWKVTTLVSCTAKGDVLPIQVIFVGKTICYLPASRQAHLICMHAQTTDDLYSITLEMFRDHVAVREGHFHSSCAICLFTRGLSILVLDYYSMHKSEASELWMTEKY